MFLPVRQQTRHDFATRKVAMQVLVGIFRRALVGVTAGFMLEQADDL